jgi:hypothetical protein
VVAVNDAVNRHVRYANIFSKEYSSRFAVKGGGYNEHIAGEAWLRKLGKNGQSEHKPIICETYSCRQRCLALYLSSPLLQTVRSSLQGNIPGASTLLNECVSNC